MGSAQLAHLSLDLTGQLSRVVMPAVRPISQSGQAVLAVTAHPGVHRLARHPITLGDLNDRNVTGDDLHADSAAAWVPDDGCRIGSS